MDVFESQSGADTMPVKLLMLKHASETVGLVRMLTILQEDVQALFDCQARVEDNEPEA